MHRSLNKKISFFGVSLLVGLFLLCPWVSQAATMVLSSGKSSVSPGDIVTVRVLVNTSGDTINNAESSISFSNDILDVLSINKSSSVFSLWVEEPKFSNPDGRITFNGGIPNPGYTGDGAEVFSVTFRAKKAGTAALIFSDAAIRKNDGQGTNVLTSAAPIQIQVVAPVKQEVVPEVTPQVITAGLPALPIVTSSTHPDTDKWYSSHDAFLEWKVPSDVIAVSTLVGRNPTSLPSVVYTSPISSKKLPSLEDGVWYFHVRFKNAAGWGPTAHFRIQVDSTAPEAFKVIFPDVAMNTASGTVTDFRTVDALSGIDHYEIRVGDGAYSTVSTQDISSGSYILPPQKAGEHELVVKAFDRAGNTTVQTGRFTTVSQYEIVPVPEVNGFGEYFAELGKAATSTLNYVFDWLSVVVILMFTVGGLAMLGVYLFYKIVHVKRTMSQKVKNAESSVHKAFALLRENVAEQVTLLEKARSKRELTKEEEKVIARLQENLTESEKFLEKQIANINKK